MRKGRPVRTAVLTELGPWSASTRYRALQHLPRLRARLGDVDVYAADDRPVRRPGRTGQAAYFAAHGVRYLQRWAQLRTVLENYDAVFVQRGLYAVGPDRLVSPLERFRGRVVFDLDDDVFSGQPALAAKGPAARWLYGGQQARRLLQRADAVVVSTEVLADALPVRPDSLTVLPTVPDPNAYALARSEGPSMVVGWAGTAGGLMYLDPLRDVFEQLGRDRTATLEVVSSRPWDGPSSFRPWALDDEPLLFSRFSIGIMPLPDTPYTRAKAGFKLLQYMAAGLPIVASPVGVNSDLVTRSGSGLLADNAADWERALRRLCADGELRRQLADNGRAFIQDYADLERQADALAELLRGRL
jgi:glycosyltransferase involved in cell wall biosynthesis